MKSILNKIIVLHSSCQGSGFTLHDTMSCGWVIANFPGSHAQRSAEQFHLLPRAHKTCQWVNKSKTLTLFTGNSFSLYPQTHNSSSTIRNSHSNARVLGNIFHYVYFAIFYSTLSLLRSHLLVYTKHAVCTLFFFLVGAVMLIKL